MCGINLILSPHEGLAQSHIASMAAAIRHRGPDTQSVLNFSPTGSLAANRLKINDLSERANLPMKSRDGRCILAWNGEVYNQEELRSALQIRGVEFDTNSDSEALLYWLQQFGVDGLNRVEGMFSLIFVDRRSNEVVVARDATGQKPMYFAKTSTAWIASSEVQGVLASSLISPALNTEQIEPYLYLRHTLPEHTFYENISQVAPGRVLVLDYFGNEKKTFQIVPKKYGHQPHTKEIFERLLTDSVRRHIPTEVPAGIILSGGADSTLLYALWAEVTGEAPPSYTIAFEDRYAREFQDAAYAHRLTTQYGGAHRALMITPAVFREHWDNYCAALDHPVGDSAGFLSWIIASEAHKSEKVLISGAGADELFGGYNRHRGFLEYLRLGPLALPISSVFGAPFFPREFRKMAASVSTDPFSTFANMAALQPVTEKMFSRLRPYFPDASGKYSSVLAYDRSLYLIEDVLKVLDNSLMTFGIEGRSPYLDYPLFAFATGATEAQQRKQCGKQWIRELLIDRELHWVAERKKLGFGIPVFQWYQDDSCFRDLMKQRLADFGRQQGDALPLSFRRFTVDPDNYIAHHFLEVWNLFMLASWMRAREL